MRESVSLLWRIPKNPNFKADTGCVVLIELIENDFIIYYIILYIKLLMIEL